MQRGDRFHPPATALAVQDVEAKDPAEQAGPTDPAARTGGAGMVQIHGGEAVMLETNPPLPNVLLLVDWCSDGSASHGVYQDLFKLQKD